VLSRGPTPIAVLDAGSPRESRAAGADESLRRGPPIRDPGDGTRAIRSEAACALSARARAIDRFFISARCDGGAKICSSASRRRKFDSSMQSGSDFVVTGKCPSSACPPRSQMPARRVAAVR